MILVFLGVVGTSIGSVFWSVQGSGEYVLVADGARLYLERTDLNQVVILPLEPPQDIFWDVLGDGSDRVVVEATDFTVRPGMVQFRYNDQSITVMSDRVEVNGEELDWQPATVLRSSTAPSQ